MISVDFDVFSVFSILLAYTAATTATGIMSCYSAPVILCLSGFGIAILSFLASASGIGSKLFFLRACRATSSGSDGSADCEVSFFYDLKLFSVFSYFSLF